MVDYQNTLSILLLLTEKLYKQVQSIHVKMKNNETAELEKVQLLVEQREEVIKELDTFMTKQADFSWSEKDRLVIEKIKDYQNRIDPLMNHLFHSFTTQMTQLNQRKQISKKYIGAYQVKSTDGSFIDKRK